MSKVVKYTCNYTYNYTHDQLNTRHFICIKYQLLDFLNKLSETNSEFLDTILENVHLQPFIGYSRLITNHLVSLYRYECCIINCYVCSIAIV